jgi:hypothetical protein
MFAMLVISHPLAAVPSLGLPLPSQLSTGAVLCHAGPDGDMWARGQALPPMPGMPYGGRGMGPPPGMRGPPGGGYMPSGGPLPALHKTAFAYKVRHAPRLLWLVCLSQRWLA